MYNKILNNTAERLLMVKCSFDDHCDFCDHPKDGTFGRDCGGYEYHDDWYYICGYCLMGITSLHPFFNDEQMLDHLEKLLAERPVKLPF